MAKFRTPYSLLDLDIAWLELLKKIGPLSDGTQVPIHFEVQRGDIRYEQVPSVNVSLVQMIPDFRNYQGWDEMPIGFTTGADGRPLNEVVYRQPEHYLIQYRIVLKTKLPRHRTDYMLRLQLGLTPRPSLKMAHLKDQPSIEGRFDGYYSLSPEAAEREPEIIGEEELLHDIWTYLVGASFPHPKNKEIKVTEMITWRMQQIDNLPDGTQETEDAGTFTITE